VCDDCERGQERPDRRRPRTLPDRDGFAVARALEELGNAVVVLVSSREAEDYGSKIETCGARGFIPKSRLSAAAFAALVE
jgi:two-component system chemotaxis response regulator CheY